MQRGDEFGWLPQALDRMRESISLIVVRVVESSRDITTASSEIAGGSQSLSDWTERAASKLQQTASAMQRLPASARERAESPREVSGIATLAAATAQRGGNAVGQVVDTMGDIQASSRRIVDIIGVIDGIAFQTNILALNAAVEAEVAPLAARRHLPMAAAAPTGRALIAPA